MAVGTSGADVVCEQACLKIMHDQLEEGRAGNNDCKIGVQFGEEDSVEIVVGVVLRPGSQMDEDQTGHDER